MRVLVTGGAGFVGTNLAARLRPRNDVTLRVLDSEVLGKREHLDNFDGEFIKGDIRDADVVNRALDGVDAVVHLAADTRVIESIEDPRLNMETNVIGTFNILDGMRKAGVKRFINASTGGAIIGSAEPPVHEGMLPSPISPYGASKMAVEGYCSAFTGSYGISALSLRFSNVFGPRSFHKGSVVAAFFKRILADKPLTVYGSGEQTRDYIYSEDICDGIIAGLDRPDVSGVIQLGTGRPVSINELIEAIREVVAPRTFEVNYEDFRPGEVLSTYCAIDKARHELGFDPKMSLKDGLTETWRWFQEQAAHKSTASDADMPPKAAAAG